MGLKMPKTEKEWCAYRAEISCLAGKDVLKGSVPTPPGVPAHEYALYLLLDAVEELAKWARLT